MKKELIGSIRFLVIMIILCGGLYTVFVTGIGQLFFAKQANGSLILRENKIVGSALIGQEFAQNDYFQGRPMTSTQLSVTSDTFKQLLNEREEDIKRKNNTSEQVPTDLLTASASNVDPHISIDAAYYQVQRIAESRTIKIEQINAIIERKKEQDLLTKNYYVNVLKLNLALDSL